MTDQSDQLFDIPTISREELRKSVLENKPEPAETARGDDYVPGQHSKELNPYWKSGTGTYMWQSYLLLAHGELYTN